jgi:hypothetical protein
MCSNASHHVYVLSCFKYLPAYLSFLSLYYQRVRRVVHSYYTEKYRYVGTYLPTYLLTWPPIFNLHSSVLGLLGCPETKFYFYFFWRAGGGRKRASTLTFIGTPKTGHKPIWTLICGQCGMQTFPISQLRKLTAATRVCEGTENNHVCLRH